jgi:hypothetical protein
LSKTVCFRDVLAALCRRTADGELVFKTASNSGASTVELAESSAVLPSSISRRRALRV